MNETMDIGLAEAKEEVVDLSKELLVLRLAFGKLKTAIARAAEPVAAVLVPALQKAVFWGIRLFHNIARVLGALLGVKAAQTAVGKSAKKTAAELKRSLAGFDQIEKLGQSDSAQSTAAQGFGLTLTPEMEALAQRIRQLLLPLQQIDLQPLQQALTRLGDAFRSLGSQMGLCLESVWQAVLVPFITWLLEQFAPAFADSLSAALKLVTALLEPLRQGFSGFMQALQPVAAFVGDQVIAVLNTLRNCFWQLTQTVLDKGSTLTGLFGQLGQTVTALWERVRPVLQSLQQHFSQVFGDMGQIAKDLASHILQALSGVLTFLTGVFSGSWKQVWEGLGKTLKGCINGIIGLLNLLLTGLTGALNGIIKAVNKISFTAPDWVPGLGGKTFGFNLKTVTAPQIPYLAQGAVLPANKPFLAMVGDQRHGTNIEAPLATIQEAVAQVLGGQLDVLMAGFDATVTELQQLRETVGHIQVGDSVIGAAAQRYAQKQAVIHGQGYSC